VTEYKSIKAALNSFLKEAAITPYVYARELPQDPDYPATVYDVISDINLVQTHDQVTGPRQARVQIDVYAMTVAEAEDAMERYFNLLAGYSGSLGVPGYEDVAIFDEGSNPDLDFEAEPTLRQLEGRSRDFMILY
jgi:hypothetical protein